MVRFKRNLLSVALASAALALAVNAQAQTAAQADQDAQAAADKKKQDEAKNLDKVTVVGIRGAIERSIEMKQASNEIIEAVTAEDIGKLPDVSIADSLARLTGVTAQRFGGRAQEINIRGFSGDFSTTLLNGREQVSLGNNRGVEFDQYPSELMSSVVVYKTQNAALVGQGLSGTVDLRTVRPLDYDQRTLAANLRGDMNKVQDRKKYGSRFSFAYIDQFADNTLGLALGYARLDSPGQSREFESWGYDNGLLGGANVFNYQTKNRRDGLAGTVQYRPNERWESTLDVFYSKFDTDQNRAGLQFGTVWGSTGAPISFTRNADNLVTQASFRNFRPVVRNDENNYRDKLTSIGWKNTFRLDGAWTMSVDLSHSQADRKHQILEGYAVLNPALPGDTLQMSLDPSGRWFNFTTGYDYTDPSILRLADPGGWGGDRWQAGYLKDMSIKDKLNSGRIDFEYAFAEGAFSKLLFGANYSERSKSRGSDENTLCVAANCASSNPVYLPIPSSAVAGVSPGFAGIDRVLDLNLTGMLGNTYILLPKNHPDIYNKNWTVDEKLTTVYLQANIDTELFGAPLTGNLGVQAVRADQKSDAIAMFNGVPIAGTASYGAKYTEYLPSLNLKLALPEDINVRFALGRQMARPRMDEMVASANYGYDPTRREFSGSGGNAALRPWLANALDFGFEKYFGKTGYFTAGYFYKDLKTYIYNATTRFDFAQLPLPTGNYPVTSTVGWFTQPVNGQGGTLQGIELALSLPFDVFWAPLEGFGFQGNYADVSSSIHPGGANAQLPGLSKYVSNMSLYFERWGFSARISQRGRSKFRGEVEGFGGDRDRNRYFAGEKVTDFQMGYEFQDGALRGLSVLLQLYNLKNEPFVEPSTAGVGYPGKYTDYGRTYLLGVNYKF